MEYGLQLYQEEGVVCYLLRYYTPEEMYPFNYTIMSSPIQQRIKGVPYETLVMKCLRLSIKRVNLEG